MAVPASFDPTLASVALAWSGAFDRRAQAAGVIGRVLSLEDGILWCEATERCLITLTGNVDTAGLPTVTVAPLADHMSSEEAVESSLLQEELKTTMDELVMVNDNMQLCPQLAASSSPSDFSLVLSGLVELNCDSQQRWLEGTSTLQRLEELKECIQPTLRYHTARKALRGLSSIW